jgi:hypothetical protein
MGSCAAALQLIGGPSPSCSYIMIIRQSCLVTDARWLRPFELQALTQTILAQASFCFCSPFHWFRAYCNSLCCAQ